MDFVAEQIGCVAGSSSLSPGHTVSARELRIHAEEAKGLFIKAGQAGDVAPLSFYKKAP